MKENFGTFALILVCQVTSIFKTHSKVIELLSLWFTQNVLLNQRKISKNHLCTQKISLEYNYLVILTIKFWIVF